MIVLAPLTKSPNCASSYREGVLVGHRVAVLEAHRRELRTAGVVDPELGLVGPEVGQRRPLATVGVVDQRSVALAERAAAGPAPRSRVGALEQQQAERQRSAVAQSTWPSSRTALSRVAICLASRMDVEVVGPAAERAVDAVERGALDLVLGGRQPTGGGSAARRLDGSADWRVSSSACCSFFWKSSSDCSASSRVSWP